MRAGGAEAGGLEGEGLELEGLEEGLEGLEGTVLWPKIEVPFYKNEAAAGHGLRR